MSKKRFGKIVFVPAERCFANILIEETPYGYKLYRSEAASHFTVIPHSLMRAIEYKD